MIKQKFIDLCIPCGLKSTHLINGKDIGYFFVIY